VVDVFNILEDTESETFDNLVEEFKDAFSRECLVNTMAIELEPVVAIVNRDVSEAVAHVIVGIRYVEDGMGVCGRNR